MSTNMLKQNHNGNAIPKIDSHRLLNGQSKLIIQHGEMQYRLQITKENKLILTK